MKQRSYDGSPILYLIPTPIGNIEDITIRAINILKEVEIIFAEDTRVTKKLLDYYGISKKLISSHLYNEEKNKEKLLNYLKNNKTIAIVSDRGTPTISDPGYYLTKIAIENNYNVVCLPGPTALIPAIAVSGLPDKFIFYGFLNSKETKRKKELEKLKNEPFTIIFYEAPHRINKTLQNLKEVFGNRYCVIVREISKKYEEIIRGDINLLINETKEIKGEIVLIVEGNKETKKYDNLSLKEHIKLYLDDGLEAKEAIKLVAKERKLPKSEVYNEYHRNE